MDTLKKKIKELEAKIDKLEVKFELLEKYIEINDLDMMILSLDLTSHQINKVVEIINQYSKTEILNEWDALGITKYTVKKELEKVSPVFIDTENVEDFISALAEEIGDENYKILAEKLSWKIIRNDAFSGIFHDE